MKVRQWFNSEINEKFKKPLANTKKLWGLYFDFKSFKSQWLHNPHDNSWTERKLNKTKSKPISGKHFSLHSDVFFCIYIFISTLKINATHMLEIDFWYIYSFSAISFSFPLGFAFVSFSIFRVNCQLIQLW